LGWALSAQLRLLAPVVPFVTDEVWSWWRYGSIHRATWPTAHELTPLVGDEPGLRLATVGEALRQIRKAKSQRKVSMRTEVSLAEVSAPAALVEEIRLASDDLRAAGHLDKLEFHPEAAAELVVACTF
jgi:valyl-tRNA synthetase